VGGGGRFGWMDGAWRPARRYADDTMVTDVTAASDALGVSLHVTDAVDFYENVLVRRIRVTNRDATARAIRVFLHHDFHLKENDVGDTALYAPETQSLLHYKDDRYFLINCQVGDAVGVQHYACGQKEVGAAEGTWRDAEDGVLSGNPIAQGSVDSTMGVTLSVGLDLIGWAARHALPSGVMAEQLHPYSGAPLSVSPLTWSQAAYVMAVEEYLDRVRRLTACPGCGRPFADAQIAAAHPLAGPAA